MKDRSDLPSANLVAESVGKRKRTKKKPLWHRIIYEEQMVALVRLLGHEGLPLKELSLKSKPLIEKFGKESLQEAADEIVEVVGDGDGAIVRLSEQAHKFAIQLLGRPRLESSTATADDILTDSASSVRVPLEALPKTTEINSSKMPCEPSRSPSTIASPEPPLASVTKSVEASPVQDSNGMPDSSRNWTNYETSCVAAFLYQDREFTDECLHLAQSCCERAALRESALSETPPESQTRTVLLAGQLQRLVSEYNPLADDASLFTNLLDAALNNVDWQEIADSFLNRSGERSDDD